MHDRILQALHQTSTSGLITALQQDYLASPDDEPTISETWATKLAKALKLSTLPSAELIALSQQCLSGLTSISSRIVVCGSKTEITDLHVGDTIVTPEGVWQIHPGFKEHLVLHKKDLETLPIDLQPNTATPLTFFDMNNDPQDDSSQAWAAALNKACAKQRNSLYIAGKSSAQVAHLDEVLGNLQNDHITPEIKHRHLFAIIYKVLAVKTDIQFTNLADKIYHEFVAYYAARGKVPGADEYMPYLLSTLPNKINFTKLSEQELKILSYSGYHFRPVRSEKIIRAKSFEDINASEQLALGDTIIVPTGVYLFDHNGNNQLLLNATEMKRVIPAGMIPTADSKLETIEPIFKFITPNTHTPLADQLPSHLNDALSLTQALNKAMSDKPNAMHLRTPDSGEDPSQISTIIYRAPALDDLQGTEYETPGATFLVPEGVYQVDEDGVIQRILSPEEMEQTMPPAMIAFSSNKIESIPCLEEASAIAMSNQHALLTQALLKGCANLPNALYFGSAMEEAAYHVTEVSSSIHFLAEQELRRRQIKDNLILKVMHVKNDTAFMNYFMTRLFPGPMSTQNLVDHITQILEQSSRVDVTGLSDDELCKLSEQCVQWRPKVSARIICSKKPPKNVCIGDTLLLPDGVYQIRIDEKTGKVTHEKLINETDLAHLDILDFIPDDAEMRIIDIDNASNNEDSKELVSVLNPVISRVPHAMYLHEENESYIAVMAVLKQMAEKELAFRAEQRLQKTEVHNTGFQVFGIGFSLFGHKKEDATTRPSANMATELEQQTANPAAKKMNLKELRIGAKRLKALQQDLQDPSYLSRRVSPSSGLMMAHTIEQANEPRLMEDIQATMHSIKEELNVKLDSDFSIPKIKDEQTVEIVQNDRVVMAASRDTVAMYKPLLQEKKLKNEKKAELFLQALGIPPTYGKQKVEVHGGNHELRKTVRALFQAYKEKELSAESDLTGDNSPSGSDSAFSFK